MKPTMGGPHWNVSGAGWLEKPVTPSMARNPVFGCIQVSNWSQKNFVIGPLKVTLLSLIWEPSNALVGVLELWLRPVRAPAPDRGGVGTVAVREPRLMVTLSGLKSNRTSPMLGGVVQRSIAGIRAPITAATPTPTPIAASNPGILMAVSSQETLVDELQLLHRDTESRRAEVGTFPTGRIHVAQRPVHDLLAMRVAQRDLRGTGALAPHVLLHVTGHLAAQPVLDVAGVVLA